MDRDLVEAYSDRSGFSSGTRTILFFYYPDHHGKYQEEPPTTSPLKWRHFRILKDLFGRDIFEKGSHGLGTSISMSNRVGYLKHWATAYIMIMLAGDVSICLAKLAPSEKDITRIGNPQICFASPLRHGIVWLDHGWITWLVALSTHPWALMQGCTL